MDFYRISIRTFHTEKHPGKAPFAHFFSHPKRSRRRCRSSSPVALVGSVCVFFPIKRGDVSLTFFAWAPNMVSCSTPRLMHGFNLSHFILQVDLIHQTFVWNQIASEAQRTSRWVILSDFVLLNLQGKHVWMKCIEMYWTVAGVFVWQNDKMSVSLLKPSHVEGTLLWRCRTSTTSGQVFSHSRLWLHDNHAWTWAWPWQLETDPTKKCDPSEASTSLAQSCKQWDPQWFSVFLGSRQLCVGPPRFFRRFVWLWNHNFGFLLTKEANLQFDIFDITLHSFLEERSGKQN